MISEHEMQFIVPELIAVIGSREYINIQSDIIFGSNIAALEKLSPPLNRNKHYLSVTACNIRGPSRNLPIALRVFNWLGRQDLNDR